MVHGNMLKVLPKTCFITWQHEQCFCFTNTLKRFEFLPNQLPFTWLIKLLLCVRDIIEVLTKFPVEFPKTKSIYYVVCRDLFHAILLCFGGDIGYSFVTQESCLPSGKFLGRIFPPKGRQLKVNRWPQWGMLASNEPLQLQSLRTWTLSSRIQKNTPKRSVHFRSFLITMHCVVSIHLSSALYSKTFCLV